MTQQLSLSLLFFSKKQDHFFRIKPFFFLLLLSVLGTVYLRHIHQAKLARLARDDDRCAPVSNRQLPAVLVPRHTESQPGHLPQHAPGNPNRRHCALLVGVLARHLALVAGGLAAGQPSLAAEFQQQFVLAEELVLDFFTVAPRLSAKFA